MEGPCQANLSATQLSGGADAGGSGGQIPVLMVRIERHIPCQPKGEPFGDSELKPELGEYRPGAALEHERRLLTLIDRCFVHGLPDACLSHHAEPVG